MALHICYSNKYQLNFLSQLLDEIERGSHELKEELILCLMALVKDRNSEECEIAYKNIYKKCLQTIPGTILLQLLFKLKISNTSYIGISSPLTYIMRRVHR